MRSVFTIILRLIIVGIGGILGALSSLEELLEQSPSTKSLRIILVFYCMILL